MRVAGTRVFHADYMAYVCPHMVSDHGYVATYYAVHTVQREF